MRIAVCPSQSLVGYRSFSDAGKGLASLFMSKRLQLNFSYIEKHPFSAGAFCTAYKLLDYILADKKGNGATVETKTDIVVEEGQQPTDH